MRVGDATIASCRVNIDHSAKKALRRVTNVISAWRHGLAEIGEGFQLGLGTDVPAGSRLGRYGYIGRGFSSPSPVSIGDCCMISTDVHIVANDHGTDDVRTPIRLAFRWSHEVTVFEGDVWVGSGAILRAGIRIGRGSVVAAGAVVVKDVAPYSIVGGNPANLIRRRFTQELIDAHDSIVYGPS